MSVNLNPERAMKPPFPKIALIAFLLLPLVAAMESLNLPFLPHFDLLPVLLVYLSGGVVGLLWFDYSPHYPAQSHPHRHHLLRDWFHHS